jgi:hypothetical protein
LSCRHQLDAIRKHGFRDSICPELLNAVIYPSIQRWRHIVALNDEFGLLIQTQQSFGEMRRRLLEESWCPLALVRMANAAPAWNHVGQVGEPNLLDVGSLECIGLCFFAEEVNDPMLDLEASFPDCANTVALPAKTPCSSVALMSRNALALPLTDVETRSRPEYRSTRKRNSFRI